MWNTPGFFWRTLYDLIVRNSRPEVCCKKGAPKNFAKFTGNTCARVSFLIKLQAPPMEIQIQPLTCFLANSCSEYFPKIHRKRQCQSIVLIKLQATVCGIVKGDTPKQIFYSHHFEILQSIFFLKKALNGHVLHIVVCTDF